MSRRPSRGLLGLLLAVALGGAVGLVAADALPVLELRAPSLTRSVPGHEQHSWALVPLGLLAAGLAVAGLRAASLAALLGLAAVGLAAALITLVGDLPDTTRTGLVRGPDRLEVARARPRVGFYVQAAAAAAVLSAAGLGLLARRREATAPDHPQPESEAAAGAGAGQG